MLKIVKATEPLTVDQIVVCLYSQPGLGKSTLAFTAEDSILFDCDKGAYRAHNRKDTVPAPDWGAIGTVAAADLAPYKTVILDTAGRALDLLTADIGKSNPKLTRGGGVLTLQGFGELKSRFGAYLRMLKTLNKDVVLICHMDEQRNGDDVIERLDVQGGSKAEIYKSADAMGRIIIGKNGERSIDFNPRENSFGKNPCALPVIPFALDDEKCLANIIATIKERLNAQVATDKAVRSDLQDWMTVIREADTVDTLNQLMPEIKKASSPVKALATKRAHELHLAWDSVKQLWILAPKAKEKAVA